MAQLLKAKEAANVLRVSLPTLYKLIKQGKLKGRKVGKEWRISQYNLNKFLNAGFEES